MKLRRLALAAMALSSLTAYAHHSLERTYDLKNEVILEGKILQILLRNPHSFLQFEVLDRDGNKQRWALEFSKGANSLRKQGIMPETLKIGDEVTITMNPSLKPGERRGIIKTLHRESDGFEWDTNVKQHRS